MGVNQQVEGVRSGPFRMGGGRRQVNETFSLSAYQHIRLLKGLSHEIDFKNFDKNLQNLT